MRSPDSRIAIRWISACRTACAALLSNRQFAVIFLNVDHFKRVNDTWGHSVGDELLITVAQRITSRLA
jgi:diguanylate cyclase (GGDEF)-like protein